MIVKSMVNRALMRLKTTSETIWPESCRRKLTSLISSTRLITMTSMLKTLRKTSFKIKLIEVSQNRKRSRESRKCYVKRFASLTSKLTSPVRLKAVLIWTLSWSTPLTHRPSDHPTCRHHPSTLQAHSRRSTLPHKPFATSSKLLQRRKRRRRRSLVNHLWPRIPELLGLPLDLMPVQPLNPRSESSKRRLGLPLRDWWRWNSQPPTARSSLELETSLRYCIMSNQDKHT